jgi:hypothetical protein
MRMSHPTPDDMAHGRTKVNRGAAISTFGRRHEDGLLLRKRYSEIRNCLFDDPADGVTPVKGI